MNWLRPIPSDQAALVAVHPMGSGRALHQAARGDPGRVIQ